MANLNSMTKGELLELLEHVPQQLWPPRPTAQAKATLVEAISHAFYVQGPQGERFRKAVAAKWASMREEGRRTIGTSMTDARASELELRAALRFWRAHHTTGSRRRVRAAIAYWRQYHGETP